MRASRRASQQHRPCDAGMCQPACHAERGPAPSAKSDSQTKLFGFFPLQREIRCPTSVSLIKFALGTTASGRGSGTAPATETVVWPLLAAAPSLVRACRRWKKEKRGERGRGDAGTPCTLPRGCGAGPGTQPRHVPVISPAQCPTRRSPFPRLPRGRQAVISSLPNTAYPGTQKPTWSSHPCRCPQPHPVQIEPPPHHPKDTLSFGGSFFCRRPPRHRCCPHRRPAPLCFSGHLNLIYFPDGFPGFPLLLLGRASSESQGMPGYGRAPTGEHQAPPARWPWGTH